MSDNQDDITFRLRADGAADLIRAFDQIGAQGRKALEDLAGGREGVSGLGSVLEELGSGATGALEGLAGRAGLVGEALTAAGPAGLAFGAVIGGLSAILSKGVADLEAEAVAVRGLEATLRATGNASGMIVEDIRDTADALEDATGVSGDAVISAAGKMAAFRNVSADVGKTLLGLSQDFVATFGGDFEGTVVRFARILNDPVKGLDSLREANISLTAAQQETVRSLWEVGNVAGSQQVIIAALEQAVGGAGAAANVGLTGALSAASKAWGDFSKAMAETSGVGYVLERSIRGLAMQMERLTPEDKIKGLQTQISQLMAEADAYAAKGAKGAEDRLRRKIYDLESELAEARLPLTLDELDKRDAAADGQRRQEIARNSEAQAQRLKELSAARIAAATDAAEKIRAVETKLAEDIGKVRARESLPGVDPADTEREISLLRDIAARKIAAIEEPQRQAAARMQEQTARVLDDLQRQLSAVANQRQAAVDAALARLPSSATTDDKNEAAVLAGAAWDARQAADEAKKSEAEMQRLRERGRAVTLQYADAEEVYAARVSELQQLLSAGVVSAAAYGKALEEADRAKLAASKEWSDGATLALRDYAKEAEDVAGATQRGFAKGLRGVEDFFAGIATGAQSGAEAFKNFANSIISDLARMMVQRTITAPLAAGLSGIMQDLFKPAATPNPGAGLLARGYASGGDHPGGWRIVGEEGPELEFTGPSRILNATKSAEILSASARPAALLPVPVAAGGGGGVVVNVYDNRTGTGGAPVGVQQSMGGDGMRQIDVYIADKVEKAVRGGQLDSAMGTTYGIRRQGVRR